MIERLAATRSGTPTCYAGDRALHSRYDPLGEAEKYIDALPLGGEIRYFILIEPALGYCVPALRRRFPGARIIALHVSAFFGPPSRPRGEEPPGALRPDALWSPHIGVGLREFLAGEIPDVEARGVKIIEWRPSLRAYGSAYLELLAETAGFIKEIDANARTVRGFGRRWFRNALRNLGLIRRVLRWGSPGPSWVITGAGPSLEEAIPLIKKQREREPLLILGVSSSVPALRAGNLEPDLVLATDGGGWALFHLYETLRARTPALAASLNAALPSQCAGFPILPLSDGSLWQEIMLRTLGIPSLSLPQRGTVTAAAVDLALRLTGGKIYLAGMDFAHRDIKTHARPYSFDRLWEGTATRFKPGYSQAYVRSEAVSGSGNNALYAGWFRRQLAAYPKRLYSLGNNHPLFDALEPAPAKDAPSGAAGGAAGKAAGETAEPGYPGGAFFSVPARERPGLTALRALTAALKDPVLAPRLCRELGPLLLPGEPEPRPEALTGEIGALAKPHGGGTGDG
jgi:hypothetical protein